MEEENQAYWLSWNLELDLLAPVFYTLNQQVSMATANMLVCPDKL